MGWFGKSLEQLTIGDLLLTLGLATIVMVAVMVVATRWME